MTVLDTSGLVCPLPILKLQQLIKTIDNGDKITIIATDIGVKEDIPLWCSVHQHKIISIEEKKGTIYIVVKKTTL